MWLVRQDGRAYNLDVIEAMEVTGSDDHLTVSGNVAGGIRLLASDLSAAQVEKVLTSLAKGEGIDLR